MHSPFRLAIYRPWLLNQTYDRRWEVYLRGERIGEVLAATHAAACLRAVQKFRIKPEDRRELEVRRAADS